MKKNSKFLMIAISLAFVISFTIYKYGYLVVRTDIAATKEASFGKERMLKKYITMIAAKPRLEGEFADLQEVRKADSSKMIEGQTPSIAAATLQNIVKNVILLRGGTISSERIEKPEGLGKFKIITVFVDAVLPDIRSLNETLFALETQRPYLVVRELDTTIRNYQTPKELTVRMKLSGLTGGK